ASAIGMEYRPLGELPVPRSVTNRSGYQGSLVVVVHGIPDDLLRAAVDNCREIQPPLTGRNVSDITDELFSRGVSGRVPADDVGHGARGGLGQAEPLRARLAGHEAQLAHELAYQLRAGGVAPARQLGVDAPVAVGAVGYLECLLDEQHQFLAPSGRSGIG